MLTCPERPGILGSCNKHWPRHWIARSRGHFGSSRVVTPMRRRGCSQQSFFRELGESQLNQLVNPLSRRAAWDRNRWISGASAPPAEKCPPLAEWIIGLFGRRFAPRHCNDLLDRCVQPADITQVALVAHRFLADAEYFAEHVRAGCVRQLTLHVRCFPEDGKRRLPIAAPIIVRPPGPSSRTSGGRGNRPRPPGSGWPPSEGNHPPDPRPRRRSPEQWGMQNLQARRVHVDECHHHAGVKPGTLGFSLRKARERFRSDGRRR